MRTNKEQRRRPARRLRLRQKQNWFLVEPKAFGLNCSEASGRDDTERKGKTMAADLNALVEQLSGLTVIEAAELSKKLEEKWGVSAAAPVAVAAAAGAGAAAAPAAEAKTTFDVVLTAVAADKKIAIIKEVRAVTSLGLKEAKDLVEGAPKTVKEDATKEEAAEIKKKIEAAGGTVELK